MKYRVSETYPCWTTWTRIVEADSPEEAQALFNEGEGEKEDAIPQLGDILDGYDIITECEES
jgi:hypothetical protein